MIIVIVIVIHYPREVVPVRALQRDAAPGAPRPDHGGAGMLEYIIS